VIDPEAFGQTLPNRYKARQRAALAKAAQIIAMQAPAVTGEAVAYKAVFIRGYSDYIADPDGLDRFRQHAEDIDGHDMAVVNGNSLARLVGTIDALKAHTDLLAAPPSPAVGGGQEPWQVAWLAKRNIDTAEQADAWHGKLLDRAHPTPVREPEGLAAELQRTFDLQWAADQRAIKRWQEATGRDMVWPDRSELTEWLLNKITALEKASEGLRLTGKQLRAVALDHDHLAVPIRPGVSLTWTDEESGEVVQRATLKGRNVVSMTDAGPALAQPTPPSLGQPEGPLADLIERLEESLPDDQAAMFAQDDLVAEATQYLRLLTVEITDEFVAEANAKATRGEVLTQTELAATYAYEIGWRDGYKASPPHGVEVTDAMVAAAREAYQLAIDHQYSSGAAMDGAIRAALHAAPPPPQGTTPVLSVEGGWQPIETAPKDRGPIIVAFSPDDWTTVEAVWRDDAWRAACWFTHKAGRNFESREHIVKPVYWMPKAALPKPPSYAGGEP
jgi:hypothetical protein